MRMCLHILMNAVTEHGPVVVARVLVGATAHVQTSIKLIFGNDTTLGQHSQSHDRSFPTRNRKTEIPHKHQFQPEMVILKQ